jgi:hypothetical protein
MEGNDFRLVQLKQMLAFMGHDFLRMLYMDELTTERVRMKIHHSVLFMYAATFC